MPDVQNSPRNERRRAAAVAGIASALAVSLVGGALVLMMPNESAPRSTALKPVTPSSAPPAPAGPESPSSSGGDFLSMIGVGDASGLPDTSASDLSAGQAGLGSSAAGPLSLPAGSPAFQLPAVSGLPAGLPATPTGPPIDWNALVAPFVAAQNSTQAANLTGSILGTSVGATAAALNSAAVIVGDLILYAAYSNNGQGILNGLQTSLAGVPAAAAATQGLSQLPAPDFSGLSAAFAAAAGAPPLGVPTLPQLPAPPSLPTPDQLAVAMAALPSIGAVGLPGLPPPPQLPRPEDVAGGVAGGLVAVAVTGAVLGAIFQPPSITRLMGLPF